MLFAIMRACERFNYDPDDFDDFPLTKRENLIAYNQIREYEEAEMAYGPIRQMAKAMSK